MREINFISRNITIDQTYIHFVERGQGEVVVLIHGLANCWEGHIPLASHLSKKYRVIIPDLPGYGDSGRLSNYNVDIMAAYLAKLYLKLGIKSRAIVGLSMGGFIAAQFARMYPNMTYSAVVMGPVLKDKHKGVEVSKYFFKGVRVIPGGKRVLKRFVDTKSIAYLFAKHLNMYKFNKQLIDDYGMRGKRKMSQDAYVEMAIAVADYDFDKALTNISVPTLLLYGKFDKISGPLYAEQNILPQNPLLQLSVIDEAGHVVSLEKSEQSALAIISFLREDLAKFGKDAHGYKQ